MSFTLHVNKIRHVTYLGQASFLITGLLLAVWKTTATESGKNVAALLGNTIKPIVEIDRS